MIDKFVFVAVVLAAIQENAVVSASLNITYYLFTSDNYNDGTRPAPMVIPEPSDASTPVCPTTTNITPLLDTIVIVHGHGGDAWTTLNPHVKDAFFQKGRDLNVIVMNWSEYTKGSYSLASGVVPSVGRSLGAVLKRLIDNGCLFLNKLHLVGFNLGAHVVGFAGRTLGTEEVARITGLDPSRSQWANNINRLSKSDARYVEVIHTDGDGLLANGLGTAVGHVDFFVNGGSNQPGCLTHACSHKRAWELFVATLIREDPLTGHPCRNNLQLTLNRCAGIPVEVGGDTLYKSHGEINVYRVNTRRSFPY